MPTTAAACHSWVKDPVYMNVTYYLNERHPKNEAHCSYHNAEDEHMNAGAGKRKAVRSSSGRERSVKTERAVRTTEKGASGQSKTVIERKNPVRKLILLYMFMVVVIWLFRLLSGMAASFSHITGSIFDSINGSDFRELTDEEARAYGGPCTDEPHFAVTIEALKSPIGEVLDTCPIPLAGTDTYSHNTVYSDETTGFLPQTPIIWKQRTHMPVWILTTTQLQVSSIRFICLSRNEIPSRF